MPVRLKAFRRPSLYVFLVALAGVGFTSASWPKTREPCACGDSCVDESRGSICEKPEFSLLTAQSTLSLPLEPKVQLDGAIFIGEAGVGVSSFLGIPYALPPIGNLRFELPLPNAPYTGTHRVITFGRACSQTTVKVPLPPGIPRRQATTVTGMLFNASTSGEDCLTLNVVKPACATLDSNLPVVVWIFGGGFSSGSTELYDGRKIVTRSIELGKPVVYVSMNYRLNGFGFLPGKEVKAAGIGNLGLHDQRLALQWIQKYISAFGGDPGKVTIWGESAGAVSVSMHLLAAGAPAGLFRAAFMQSGAPVPMGDIAGPRAQEVYARLVAGAGCSDSPDTLQCLKAVEYEVLKRAIEDMPDVFSYSSLTSPWTPRADGVLLPDALQRLVRDRHVARVPFVAGNCDDEGTLFSLSTLNITTTNQLRTYLHETYMPHASAENFERVLTAYPDDITQGSPFGTGLANALTPQFKRLAALQGDIVFTAPRRFLVDRVADKQDVWVFLSKRKKTTPILGAAHGTDIENVFGGGELTEALVRLATGLDPGPAWPKFDVETREVLTFYDKPIPNRITHDTDRSEGMRLLTEIGLANPL